MVAFISFSAGPGFFLLLSLTVSHIALLVTVCCLTQSSNCLHQRKSDNGIVRTFLCAELSSTLESLISKD